MNSLQTQKLSRKMNPLSLLLILIFTLFSFSTKEIMCQSSKEVKKDVVVKDSTFKVYTNIKITNLPKEEDGIKTSIEGIQTSLANLSSTQELILDEILTLSSNNKISTVASLLKTDSDNIKQIINKKLLVSKISYIVLLFMLIISFIVSIYLYKENVGLDKFFIILTVLIFISVFLSVIIPKALSPPGYDLIITLLSNL